LKKAEPEPDLAREAERRRARLQRKLLRWGRKNYRDFLWRQNRTPYRVLVSEILLKRTTAPAAADLYPKFIALYPTVESLAKADRKELETLLARIGYHRKRADILIEVAKCILGRHGGEIPKTKEALLEIPNIGPYTAAAVLTLGYGTPSAMVDSNVERIIKRLFLRFDPKPRAVREMAEILAPESENQAYSFALLDLGALVCRYGVPKCNICPIRDLCDYYGSDKPRQT
jgi:A/G-specific adenine glycosylase